jgi:hypothetical protein
MGYACPSQPQNHHPIWFSKLFVHLGKRAKPFKMIGNNLYKYFSVSKRFFQFFLTSNDFLKFPHFTDIENLKFYHNTLTILKVIAINKKL